MPSGWIGLDMNIIVYVQMTSGKAYFKPRGVKKDPVPYMIEIVLTNLPN